MGAEFLGLDERRLLKGTVQRLSWAVPTTTWWRLPSRVPSRLPPRVPRRVDVKLDTLRGTLEGTLRGKQNLATTRSVWPRPPPPQRDCKGDCTAGLRPDPTPPTTWVVGSGLRLVVRRLERRRGGGGRGQKWSQ